jgi:hypothetical protein
MERGRTGASGHETGRPWLKRCGKVGGEAVEDGWQHRRRMARLDRSDEVGRGIQARHRVESVAGAAAAVVAACCCCFATAAGYR